ncbi:MAG: AI-2E family transporter, partial [Eubacteriales bacterium]
MTIWFIIMVFALQQLDGNVIGPKILGDFIGLSPLWIIVSITVMGGLFGVFGMFLGVPTFAVIYAIIKEITEKNLQKKGLPTETASYYTEPTYRDIVQNKPKDSSVGALKQRIIHVISHKKKGKDQNDSE